jgi:cytochrome b6-f complex iron-sulfur subunit
MAKRPSVKEILEAARRGGPAKPADAAEGGAAPAEEAAPAAEPEPVVETEAAPSGPPANVPTPASLGRPLTLKEKLAAARAGGAATPGAAKPAARPAAAEPAASEPEAAASEPAEAAAPPLADVPTPEKLGRPLTLAEKLAAARAGGGKAPAAPAAKPAAGAKPAAAAPAPKAAARTLPPLDKMTDPKDLAEALRRTGAKEAAAKAAAAPAKPAAKGGHKDAKPQSVLPRPAGRPASDSTAHPERRQFLVVALLSSWIFLGWASFVAGISALTLMCVKFMFPNVLAEPPSTVKIGLPSTFDPEDVTERFKAEWGFWVVRSTRYNGDDIVYALQSVCTHLGCPPNWLAGEQKFKCPCHGSGFYISGINFEGPAPRPLERFKVTLADDGQIMVDKSQKFQEELQQWTDPDSFIKVV